MPVVVQRDRWGAARWLRRGARPARAPRGAGKSTWGGRKAARGGDRAEQVSGLGKHDTPDLCSPGLITRPLWLVLSGDEIQLHVLNREQSEATCVLVLPATTKAFSAI